jgi:hypothetical protein
VSRKCGSLEVSQLYGPPWPVTRIALALPYLFDEIIHHEVPVLIITSSNQFWQGTSGKKMLSVWSKINSSYVEESVIVFFSLNPIPIENLTFCYTCHNAFTLAFFCI